MCEFSSLCVMSSSPKSCFDITKLTSDIHTKNVFVFHFIWLFDGYNNAQKTRFYIDWYKHFADLCRDECWSRPCACDESSMAGIECAHKWNWKYQQKQQKTNQNDSQRKSFSEATHWCIHIYMNETSIHIWLYPNIGSTRILWPSVRSSCFYIAHKA